jgi:hypothetical protein
MACAVGGDCEFSVRSLVHRRPSKLSKHRATIPLSANLAVALPETLRIFWAVAWNILWSQIPVHS